MQIKDLSIFHNLDDAEFKKSLVCTQSVIHEYKKNDYMVILVLEIVCLQSIMEHHMIQYWYNPYIITLFCYWIKKNSVEENNDMIVNLN